MKVPLERHQARETRGRVLKILQRAYPDPVGSELITLILQENQYDVVAPTVAGYVDYLKDKGYVTTEEVSDRDLDLSRHLVRLTPKGIDLLEGNIPPDPGVRV